MSEAYRNTSSRRVCQVDIAENYDHKHQEMGTLDHSGGLSRMSHEITKAFFRKLGTEGCCMDNAFFRAVKATYLREALDLLDNFDADAHINGLSLDIHKEEKAIELFASSIIEAGETYQQKPMEVPFMPNWRRVFSAVPDLTEQIMEAVTLDNA